MVEVEVKVEAEVKVKVKVKAKVKWADPKEVYLVKVMISGPD